MKPYQVALFVLTLFMIMLYSTRVEAVPQQDDALYLHYDCAPDPDDIHAIAAGRILTRSLGVEPNVVVGAHGYQLGGQFRNGCITMANQAYGNDYLQVQNNFGLAQGVAQEWDTVIRNGGTVYVAEGGPSDFTFEVLQRMNQSPSNVTVVQHSTYNETHTRDSSLNFVRNNTNYIRIADGNVGNTTAALRQEWTTSLRNLVRGSDPLFVTATDLFNVRIDFSDTVEVLHIYGINTTQVSTVTDFIQFVDGGPVAPPPPPPAVGSQVVVNLGDGLVAAQGAGDKSWVRRTELGRTGYQLLPDTRVTHNDPLLAGVNFWNFPTPATPYIEYTFQVDAPGQYLAEVSALSRGSEDNGAHMWLNGEYVLDRIQWCGGRGQWTDSSRIRLETNHCGVEGAATVALQQGTNTMRVAAREDGLFVSRVTFTPLGGVVVAQPSPAPVATPAPTPVGGQCTVVGDTLAEAANAYEQQCTLPRRDCDPVAGQWLCSSLANPQLSDLVDAPAPVVEPTPAPPAPVAAGVTRFTLLNLPDSTRTPRSSYADSYSYQGQCYISSNFDHGIGDATIGGRNVRDIAATQGGPGIAQADATYNSINCGHPPYNNAGDEQICPGVVTLGRAGCLIAGPNIGDQL